MPALEHAFICIDNKTLHEQIRMVMLIRLFIYSQKNGIVYVTAKN